jgi:hypothetical protein
MHLCNGTRYLQVEIKTTKSQQDTGLLQKAADYVHAYILGTCTMAQDQCRDFFNIFVL